MDVMAKNTVSLSSLSPGDIGTVMGLHGVHGAARQRLLEMGLMQGVRIRFVRRAPLGDPIEIHLSGYHLMLRNSEAIGISVHIENGV